MDSTEDEKKLLLKLTQFKSLIGNDKNTDKKIIETIFQELDLNSKILFNKNLDNAVIGDILLHLAYEKKNIHVFTALICRGANFNAKDETGSTVLHKAFQTYATVNESNYSIKKPLTDLITTEMLFVHSILLAHVKCRNTDNPADPSGLTYFHIACASQNIEAIELFLSNGVSVDQAVVSGRFEKYTPLHFAARYLCTNTAEILLKHGANINLKNRRGMTPLHMCVEMNIAYIDCLKSSQELVDRCESLMTLLLNYNDVHPEFPHLFVVSAMQDSHLTESLLSRGVDVNQTISTDSKIWPGYTALRFAAHVNVDTVKLLIKHGANILAYANGSTPLDMCIQRYSLEDIVDIINLIPAWKGLLLPDDETKLVDLLAALKDLDGIRNFLQKSKANGDLFRRPFTSFLWPGSTVLHLAVELCERTRCKSNYKVEENVTYFEPDLSVVAEILNQGADVTVVDHWNATPIHYAFRTGRTRVLDLLLEHHHRLKNCVDAENLSHLHIACATGNDVLAKKLLWNDADVNVVYKGVGSLAGTLHPGWTPLHVAVSRGDLVITKILLARGANPHSRAANFFTPVHSLIGRVHPSATRLGRLIFSSLDLREDRVVEHMGLSYLHVACWVKNVDAARKLLDIGVDVNKVVDINMKACNGGTPLHFALANSVGTASRKTKAAELEMLKLLIERGADIVIENSEGISPLAMILTSNDHEHLFDVVIATLRSSYSLRKRIEEESGLTLLHLACCRLDLDLTMELLDSGVDVNARIHPNSKVWPDCTALHVLFSYYCGPRIRNDNNHDATVRLLLGRGADVTLKNARQSTVLHIAYRLSSGSPTTGHLMLLNHLLKAHQNFEVNPTSLGGVSHFHIACHTLNVEAVRNFLEHDVDVNATVELSYDSKAAGCSPLLLAVKATHANDESFAQLEVVSLLIERGAEVNVEDVSRNTPLHYAAVSRFHKQTLLQLLIKSGANVNATNVRGETPLEFLLKTSNSTVEEIRYFLASGCRLNVFNSATDVGYIALAACTINREELPGLLFGAFMNFPDSMRVDDRNRTAIHNLVSANESGIDHTWYVDLFDVCTKFGCDIDDQDCLGRTALHLAAEFRNEGAVAGLLLAGADVNITDADGKTPFAYAFEPCSRCKNGNTESDQYKHFGLFEQFAMRTLILKFYELHMNESNLELLNRAIEKFNDILDDLGFALVPISRMKLLKIKSCDLTLKDFLQGSVVVDYPTMSPAKRDAIKEYFRRNRSIFYEEYKDAPGIFRLQYRQAMLRRKIINEAKDCLSVLMRFRLPDICSHIILRYLKNVDLQSMISSAAQKA